jgi:hypothetical protein
MEGFMKRYVGIISVLFLTGCANIAIPNYIQDKYPYKRTLYADFNEVHQTATDVLKKAGWTIEGESEPAVFERERAPESSNQQTLLFTEVRQFSFFIGSGYTRLNVYIRQVAAKETEVEIRYLKVTSIIFKNFYRYRNDQTVDRVFQRIEEQLG